MDSGGGEGSEPSDASENGLAVAAWQAGDLRQAQRILDAWLVKHPTALYPWINRKLLSIEQGEGKLPAVLLLWQRQMAASHPGAERDPQVAAFLKHLEGSLLLLDESATVLLASPDGARLFIGAGPDVYIYDGGGTVSQVLRSSELPSLPVKAMAYRPQSQELVVCHFGGLIRVWDLTQSLPLYAIEGPACWAERVRSQLGDKLRFVVAQAPLGRATLHRSAALSQDGYRVLLSWEEVGATLWDVRTGRLERALEGSSRTFEAVALSADGRLALAAGRDACQLWDGETGAPLRALAPISGSPSAVALSADGRKAALAAGYDRTLRLWDTTTGRAGPTLQGHGESISSLSFSADGKLLLSASEDQTLRLWDCESGRCLRVLSGHGAKVLAGLLHPTTQLPISSGGDKTLFFWKEPTERCPPLLHTAAQGDLRAQRRALITRLGEPDRAAYLALRELAEQNAELRQDAELLGALHRTGLRAGLRTDVRALFRPFVLDTKDEPRVLSLAAQHGAFSDSRGSVFLFHLERGDAPQRLAIEQRIDAVALSPEGRHLLTAAGRQVQLWNREGSSPVATLEHGLPVLRVGFSPDSALLWTVTREESALRVFDVATQQPRGTPITLPSAVESVWFSPNGAWLLVLDQRCLTLWDVATGQLLRALTEPYSSVVTAAFAGDGLWVVVATSRGLEWLDTGSGKSVASIALSCGRCVALSPDARLLAAATPEKKLALWDTTTGRLLQEIELPPDRVGALSFSSDGQYLLATGWSRQQIFRLQSEWVFAEEIVAEAERLLGASWPPSSPPPLWPQLQKGSPLEAHLELWAAVRKAAQRPDLPSELSSRITALRAGLPEILSRDALQQQSPFGRTASPPSDLRRRKTHPVYRISLVDAALAAEVERALQQALPAPAPRPTSAPTPVPSEGAEPVVSGALPTFAELYRQLDGNPGALQAILPAAAHHAAGEGEQSTWGEFLCRQAAVLGVGGATALLERALAEQPGTPVRALATSFLASDAPRRGYLRSRRPLGPVPGQAGHRTLLQHREGIRAAAALPDGRSVVVALGNDLQIINLRSGLVTAQLQGHKSAVQAVAVDPLGQRVASVSYDGEVRIWDLGRQGACIQTLAEPCKGANRLLITPEGQRLVVNVEGGPLKVFQLDSGALLHTLTGHSSTVTWFLLHPDGELLLSRAYDRSVRVWELRSGQCVQVLSGDIASSDSLVIFDDGVRALYATYRDLVCWDLAAADPVRQIRAEGNDRLQGAMVLHPDQRHLIAAHSSYAIGVWDLEGGTCIKRLAGHTGTLNVLLLLPDGRHVVTASNDGTLRSWDLQAGAQDAVEERHRQSVSALAAPAVTGLAISAAEDKTLRLWSCDSGESVRALQITEAESAQLGGSTLQSSGAREILLHPDGRRAITRSESGALLVWDLESGRFVRALTGHTRRVQALALHPDGWRLASAAEDGTVRIWDLESGGCLDTLSEHSEPATALLFLAGGERLVAGYADGTIRIWEVEQKQVAARLLGVFDRISALWLDERRGTLLSADEGENVVEWDLGTGTPIGSSKPGFRASRPLSGGELFVGAKYDGEVHVVRAHDGQLLARLKGHRERPAVILPHPHRPLLLSAGSDRTARLWDYSTGECLGVFYGEAPLTAAALRSGGVGDGAGDSAGDSDRWIVGDATGQVLVLEHCPGTATEPAIRQPAALEIRWQRPEQAAELRALAAPADGSDVAWLPLREALAGHREGLLWLPDSPTRQTRALLAVAASDAAPAPFGPELRIYYRFTFSPHDTCQRRFLHTVSPLLRGWPGFAELEPPAAPPPGLSPTELLMHTVKQQLTRLMTGRVVFILDGLEAAEAQDPWFLRETIGGLRAPRVLWLCAGRPTASLRQSLQQVEHRALFPDDEPVAPPEPAQDEVAALLEAGPPAGVIEYLLRFRFWMEQLDSGAELPRLELKLRRLQAAAPDDAALAPWLEFVKRHHRALTQGGAAALLPLAYAEGGDSPMARAAEEWLATTKGSPPWLRRLHRPATYAPDPLRAVLVGHRRPLRGLSLDPQGRLLSYADDGTVRLWDLEHDRCTVILKVPEARAVQALGDSQRLLVVQRGLSEWDPATGACVRRCHASTPSTFAIAPQQRWVGFVDWRQIDVWDPARMERVRTIDGISGRTDALVAHPDGRHLLTAGDDRTVRTWDLEAGACVRTSSAFSSAVRGLFIHPDQKRLLVACEQELGLYDLESGTTLASYRMEIPYTPRLGVSQDGRELFLAHSGRLRIYDLQTGALTDLRTISDSSITALFVHPDGVRLISGHEDGRICVTTLQGRRPSRSGYLGDLRSLDIEESSQAVMAAVPEGLQRWDLTTAAPRDPRPWPSERPPIHTLAAAHGMVLAVDAKHVIEVWDLAKDVRLHQLAGHKSGLRALAVNTRADRLLSLSQDSLRLWDLESGACVLEWDRVPEALKAREAHLLPGDRQILVTVGKGPAQIWDLESRTCVEEVDALNSVEHIHLDAQGLRLAVLLDDKVEVRDLATRTLLASWRPPLPPRACALSTQGVLVVASAAGELTYLQLEGATSRDAEGETDKVKS